MNNRCRRDKFMRRPFRACCNADPEPRACALGFPESPLRGLIRAGTNVGAHTGGPTDTEVAGIFIGDTKTPRGGPGPPIVGVAGPFPAFRTSASGQTG